LRITWRCTARLWKTLLREKPDVQMEELLVPEKPPALREMAKSVLELLTCTAENQAKVLATVAGYEEKMNQLDSNYAQVLTDPSFWPSALKGAPPDVVGRMFIAVFRGSELTNATKDLTKLSTAQKRQFAKDFEALAEELKWLQEKV